MLFDRQRLLAWICGVVAMMNLIGRRSLARRVVAISMLEAVKLIMLQSRRVLSHGGLIRLREEIVLLHVVLVVAWDLGQVPLQEVSLHQVFILVLNF